jgi:hypothetical protein
MKIALVVVTCLVAVSVSYQQRYFWAPIPAYSPKINYLPFYLNQQDDSVSQYAQDDSQVKICLIFNLFQVKGLSNWPSSLRS